MDSWDKSDSFYGCENSSEHKIGKCENCFYDIECNNLYRIFNIGLNDLELAQRLIKAGNEHAKFLRQIFVSVDISAPRYWWSEFDTYKIGTTANSCSTMHKISAYPITKEMFEIDTNMTEDTYWNIVIDHLESLRQKYNETNDIKWFRYLKQELPESFIQKRTVTLNYAVIRNMYLQRKNHRLKEWSINFINWIKSLPYAKELIMFE